MLKCVELERTFEVIRPTSSFADEEMETQQGQLIGQCRKPPTYSACYNQEQVPKSKFPNRPVPSLSMSHKINYS